MSDKQKALDLALTQIERQFGKGSIMKLGEASAKLNVEVIPTGTLSLDIALGVGAYRGAGLLKYSGLNHPANNCRPPHYRRITKDGRNCSFVDAEHALDPLRQKFGVDIENLLVSQPDTGEQALEIAEALVRSGAIDVIVVDRRGCAGTQG